MSARTFPPADLPVVIPAWEIECCAPLPVVGETASWRLAFESVATTDGEPADRVPGSIRRQMWQVEAWPAGDGDRRALYRNGVAAYFYPPPSPGSAQAMTAPPLGRQLLRGVLFGTRHGGSDYDLLPMVSAMVTRVQVISCEMLQQDGVAAPVPGSNRLVDVRQSPKWFSRHPPGPVTSVPTGAGGQFRRRVVQEGLVYRAETGVLLTIADSHPKRPRRRLGESA